MNTLQAFKHKLHSGFFGFWIRQWRMTYLVLGLMILIGLSAVLTIPKESSPEVQLGVILVNTVYPGGTPIDIDQLITEKIEKKIKNLEGIKKVSSTSIKNLSSITVELKDDADSTSLSSKIRDAVSQINFPENVEKANVIEVDMRRNQLFNLILYAENPAMDKIYLKAKADLIKQRLEGKFGIDTIEVEGGNRYDLELLVDQQKLKQIGLNLPQLAGMIQSATSNQALGNHQLGTMNYDFRIQGEVASEAELAQIPLLLGNGKTLPLGQLVRFQKVYQDQDQLLNIGEAGAGIGKLAVNLTFTKKSGSSVLKASRSAKKAIEEELSKPEYEELGSFYTVDIGEYIAEDYDKLAVNGLTTLLIVFLIVLAFVGAKESFIATLSIPLAFFVTFFVLKAMGLSLNFLTNFSLIICLGIAIDTATVIIQGASENIKAGYSPMNAALLSVKTYKNSLISGTATTVVVFLPMLTLPGIMGKFLAYIPTTIFITLLASLFISLTITPALFFKLSKNPKFYEKNPEQEPLLSEGEQALLAEERKEKTERSS